MNAVSRISPGEVDHMVETFRDLKTANRFYLQRLEELEVENQLLKDRNKELETAMTPPTFECPVEWRLTASERRVFTGLLSRELCPREYLMMVLYPKEHESDRPDIKIVDVFICKVRTKLHRFGIEIVTKWGVGFHINKEQRLAMLKGEHVPFVEVELPRGGLKCADSKESSISPASC